MVENVAVLPTFGKAITLDDQGVYYALNQRTGLIQSVIQLIYQDDHWYLFQAQNLPYSDEVAWTLMSENSQAALHSMNSAQIHHHFSQPQYQDPQGAWQVLRNTRYAFGKFTPLDTTEPVGFAILLFTGNRMHAPLRVHKFEDNVIQQSPMLMEEALA